MAKAGLLFGFKEPDGWAQFREGERWVFQGPKGEELIVSGVLTLGEGSADERTRAQESSFRAAMDAALRTATDPALMLRHGPIRELQTPPLEVWSIDAVTRDGDRRFLQAVARAPGGVMLVTLECAECPGAYGVFRSFIESIHLVIPVAEA